MIVSFATGVVAEQALQVLEFETEFTQTSERQPLSFPFVISAARSSVIQIGSCGSVPSGWRIISEASSMTVASFDDDYLTEPWMKAISDRRFTRLIVGIISLLRRRLALS